MSIPFFVAQLLFKPMPPSSAWINKGSPRGSSRGGPRNDQLGMASEQLGLPSKAARSPRRLGGGPHTSAADSSAERPSAASHRQSGQAVSELMRQKVGVGQLIRHADRSSQPLRNDLVSEIATIPRTPLLGEAVDAMSFAGHPHVLSTPSQPGQDFKRTLFDTDAH